eukprot:1088612-Rhodomonas_salina.3
MRAGKVENRTTGRAFVTTRDFQETLRAVKSLDYSYEDLALFVTYAQDEREFLCSRVDVTDSKRDVSEK